MKWQTKKLGDICEITTGNSNTVDAISDGKYAFFDRSKSIKRSRRYLFDSEALIIPGEGSEFFPRYYSGKFDLHQRAYALLNFNQNNNIKFVEYYLVYNHKYFERVAVGATAKSLRRRHFEDLMIPLPPHPEQHRIVAILDEAFAAIAKAKANVEQNLKNTKELFGSHLQLVFENKGDGWEEKPLGEVCELINRGVSPKYLKSEGVIVLNQKCIRDHKVNFEQSRFHDGMAKKVSTEKMVQIGDVLVNSTGTGTLGRVAQIREELKNVTVDSHITIIRPIPNMFNIYFFGWALIYIEDEIAKQGEGCGGQTELARNTLKNEFRICFPKLLKDQQTIVQKLDALSAETKKLETIYQKKIEAFDELKKSILQKAFAGEL